MIWFTSDTHFGHKNIVRSCSDWADKSGCRDFDSVEEHDKYILAKLNKYVKPDDELVHLGDFGFGFAWKERFPVLREQIACKNIRLILGNHDHIFEDKRFNYLHSLFTRVDKFWYGKLAGKAFVLCHYAMRTWPWQNQLSYHLYGHSHGNLPDNVNSLSLDVGVDTMLYGHEKYTPYSAEEICSIMSQKSWVPEDHHK